MFNGMSHTQIGEELWAMAGDMSISAAVESYGNVEGATEAAVAVLAESENYDEISDAAGDPAHCIRVYLEHELGL